MVWEKYEQQSEQQETNAERVRERGRESRKEGATEAKKSEISFSRYIYYVQCALMYNAHCHQDS